MTNPNDIVAQALGLPWNAQVAIASGYASYILSYRGVRHHHKAIDIAFTTLAFAAIATGILWLINKPNAPIKAATATFFSTILVSLLWRRLGSPAIALLMRALDISWSNDDPSSIDTIVSDSKCRVSQIAVLLDDNTWLRCDDTSRFASYPFGPYTLGPAGDVALYLTHEDKNESESRELKSVIDPKYGSRITYVPANRIKRITLRFSPKANRPLTGEAAAWLRSLCSVPLAGRKSAALPSENPEGQGPAPL